MLLFTCKQTFTAKCNSRSKSGSIAVFLTQSSMEFFHRGPQRKPHYPVIAPYKGVGGCKHTKPRSGGILVKESTPSKPAPHVMLLFTCKQTLAAKGNRHSKSECTAIFLTQSSTEEARSSTEKTSLIYV